MNSVLHAETLPGSQTLEIVQGDITSEDVDAIVNAANEYLAHGGGLAALISKRGGPAVQKESMEWIRAHGAVEHSAPAWTSGGLLPARFIIHAVGPVWGTGDEDQKLSDAVRGALRVADELGCNSVALPAISTGIFGFPMERAAGVIRAAIKSYFDEQSSGIKLVRIILFDSSTVDAFLKVWPA